MRERLARFMQGRYGMDQFDNFLLILAMLVMVSTFFIRFGPFRKIVCLLVYAIVIYAYYRILSRDHYRRSTENQHFMRRYNQIRFFVARKKNHMVQRRTHHIYKCPGCRQCIRVPKGKGWIVITCPMCHTEFKKRS